MRDKSVKCLDIAPLQRIRFLAIAPVLSLVLAACGSGQDVDTGTVGDSEASVDTSTAETNTVDANSTDQAAEPGITAKALGNNLAVAKTNWLDWSNIHRGIRYEGSTGTMVIPPPPRGQSQTIGRMHWVQPLEPGSYYFHFHIPRHLNSTFKSEAILFYNDGHHRSIRIKANNAGYGGRWTYINKRTSGFWVQLQSGWKATNTERLNVFLRPSK